jgi:hypothetical protein
LYALISASAMGALFGGAFNTVAQVAGGAANQVSQQQQGGQDQGGMLQQRLQGLIDDNMAINTQALTVENFNQLLSRIQVGDRQGAVNFMVQNLGVEPANANTVVDQMLVVTGSPEAASPQTQERINEGVDIVSRTAWSLFFAILLSLILALGGGTLGAKNADRPMRSLHGAKPV